jgi:glucose-6-phosphate dehydrogenase assembly protein OpcA
MSTCGTHGASLWAAGADVPFKEIERAFQQTPAGAGQFPARALTATVVVISAHDRLLEAAGALDALAGTSALRVVLISGGDDPAPRARMCGQAIALEGLQPGFFNNAVAALRLSSLPTLVWWRGAPGDSLEGVAELSDRVVLDAEDPQDTWAQARRLFGRTAISDIRWTRLTRWRALMAHFFDIPEVRHAGGSFDRLEMAGADVYSMRLFAGWLSSALGWRGRVSIDMRELPGAAPLESVRLVEGGYELSLALAPSRACVQTTAKVRGREGATRTVALGDQGLTALIAEELRVRSRDLAFEQAVAALEELR